MSRMRRAPRRRRLPAASVCLPALLLVLAVASVGVGGSGLDRAGSIVQVASGPDVTPGVGSVSDARTDANAARLEAAVLGRPPADGRAGGSAGRQGGGPSDGRSGSSSGGTGSDASSGAPGQPGSDTGTGAASVPSSGAGSNPPGAGGPAGGGLGDTVDDTVGGVTDQVPDLPKPLPIPDDVVDGILDKPKVPGGLDKPNRLVP